jgi:hypothetical protein
MKSEAEKMHAFNILLVVLCILAVCSLVFSIYSFVFFF